MGSGRTPIGETSWMSSLTGFVMPIELSARNLDVLEDDAMAGALVSAVVAMPVTALSRVEANGAFESIKTRF